MRRHFGIKHGRHRQRRGFFRARLHRRILLWLGIAIFASVAAGGITLSLLDPWHTGGLDVERMRAFAADRFARVWHEPEERADLARGIASAFNVDITVEDPSGRVLEQVGETCSRRSLSLDIAGPEAELGHVRACYRHRNKRHGSLWLALLAAGITLWLMTSWIAHRLTRPLRSLTQVAHDLGEGKLTSRTRLARQAPGEIGELADSMDEMARRIERQLRDQRELLAAVSHEIRTPLARLRVLTELMRGTGATTADSTTTASEQANQVPDQIEREIRELDALSGQLLANSRLDFDAVERRRLDPRDLAVEALERFGLNAERLEAPDACPAVEGDATLIHRALANLIQNAEGHGQGLTLLRLVVEAGPPRDPRRRVRFEVVDRGPGFSAAALEIAFEPFRQRQRNTAGSLGLGLSLVRRIARAHGGEAAADNPPEGGAIVSFSVRTAADP